MKKKSTFCIRNWSEYNASLKQRGSLTGWVNSGATANWTTTSAEETGHNAIISRPFRFLSSHNWPSAEARAHRQ